MRQSKNIKTFNSKMLKIENSLKEVTNNLSELNISLDSKKMTNILDDYVKIEKKLAKLNKKVNKVINEIDTNDNINKTDNTNKSIEFIDIQNIDISKSAGKLPVEGHIYAANTCYVDVDIYEGARFIIKKGSIICRSRLSIVKKIKSVDTVNIRTRIMKDESTLKLIHRTDKLKIRKGENKYKVLKNIEVNGVKQLFEVIYGKPLSVEYSTKDIQVNSTTLDDYLRFGQ